MLNIVYKRIYLLPVLAVFIGILILYPFLYSNCLDVYYIIKIAFILHKLTIPRGFNLKYFVLFTGLIIMSTTDMLVERIDGYIPVFLVLMNMLFTFMLNKPFTPIIYAICTGLSIFLFVNLFKIGSYALGDILAAGAIGAFVGIRNIIIISICSMILGRVIVGFSAGVDSVFDDSEFKQFHFAFIPILFLTTSIVFALRYYFHFFI